MEGHGVHILLVAVLLLAPSLRQEGWQRLIRSSAIFMLAGTLSVGILCHMGGMNASDGHAYACCLPATSPAVPATLPAVAAAQWHIEAEVEVIPVAAHIPESQGRSPPERLIAA